VYTETNMGCDPDIKCELRGHMALLEDKYSNFDYVIISNSTQIYTHNKCI
jgi:hypothetical protein